MCLTIINYVLCIQINYFAYNCDEAWPACKKSEQNVLATPVCRWSVLLRWPYFFTGLWCMLVFIVAVTASVAPLTLWVLDVAVRCSNSARKNLRNFCMVLDWVYWVVSGPRFIFILFSLWLINETCRSPNVKVDHLFYVIKSVNYRMFLWSRDKLYKVIVFMKTNKLLQWKQFSNRCSAPTRLKYLLCPFVFVWKVAVCIDVKTGESGTFPS